MRLEPKSDAKRDSSARPRDVSPNMLSPVAAVVLVNVIVAGAVSPISAQMSQRAKAVVEALRTGGIEAAAALEGHYEGRVSADPENNADSIEQLVDWHDLVVVGRIQANRGWMTGDGESVVTDYVVRVEQVLKGRATAEITVSVVGGRVSFSNGTTATLTSSMIPPTPGERYLFFLVPSTYPVSARQLAAARGQLWELQHMSLSIFFLHPEKGVVPRAHVGHPLRQTYEGMVETDFIRLIQRLVRG